MTQDKKKNITVWENSRTIIESQWGVLTYEQWCIKESERMNSRGGHTTVIRRADEVAVGRAL